MHKNSQKINNHELKNLSKTDFSLKDEKLNTLLNEAYFEIGRLNGLLEMLPQKDILLSPLLVMESVKSSNVENINSTVLDQLQIKVKGRKILNSEQKQTENYRLALLAGFDYLNQKNSFDLDLIKLIQKTLEPNLTEIRDTQKVVIANTATSEIIWEPPLGEKNILKLLENWLEIANENSLDDLVKVCILHSQFEAIHPFVDSNGRTGRILITLYLVFKKYLSHPSLYLSDYILQTRTYYYMYLQESQQNQSHLELVKYLLKGISTKAKSGSNLILDISNFKNKIEKNLQKSLPKIYSPKLVEYLCSSPFYSISSICEALLITRNTASKYLNLLTQNNFIQIYENKKTLLFYQTELLKLLS